MYERRIPPALSFSFLDHLYTVYGIEYSVYIFSPLAYLNRYQFRFIVAVILLCCDCKESSSTELA